MERSLKCKARLRNLTVTSQPFSEVFSLTKFFFFNISSGNLREDLINEEADLNNLNIMHRNKTFTIICQETPKISYCDA